MFEPRYVLIAKSMIGNALTNELRAELDKINDMCVMSGEPLTSRQLIAKIISDYQKSKNV